MPRKRRPKLHYKQRLTIAKILAWADAYHRQHGTWPYMQAGPIEGAEGETWCGVCFALYLGGRGLKGKSSLSRFLQKHRGVFVRRQALDEATIFNWAKAHFDRTGRWPNQHSGPIQDAPGEKWNLVNGALTYGYRGLPGGSSLSKLLTKRGISRKDKRNLTPEQILTWADQFFAEHGDWPRHNSGPICESPENTWLAVDFALRKGTRGLKEMCSLLRFLDKHRDILHGKYRPTRPEHLLSLDKIMAWAKAHKQRTGEWPKPDSGPIPDSAGSNWQTVDMALRKGYRGLPGGSSLARLFGDRRKKGYR